MTDDIAVYTAAFWSSDCCRAPYWRVCFGGVRPDRYVCRSCQQECLSVETRELDVNDGSAYVRTECEPTESELRQVRPTGRAPYPQAMSVVRITAPHFIAGVVIDEDSERVIKAAPIVSYMHGWSLKLVRSYAERRGWSVKRYGSGGEGTAPNPRRTTLPQSP